MPYAVQLTAIGPEPSLAVIEVTDPKPAQGRALVAFAAAEVAPIDVQIATGKIPGIPPPPLLPAEPLREPCSSRVSTQRERWCTCRVDRTGWDADTGDLRRGGQRAR